MLATHLPNLATHLPDIATHLPNFAKHLPEKKKNDDLSTNPAISKQEGLAEFRF